MRHVAEYEMSQTATFNQSLTFRHFDRHLGTNFTVVFPPASDTSLSNERQTKRFKYVCILLSL